MAKRKAIMSMKKVWVILFMLIGLVRPSRATVLSDAAAALQPGQWTTITTNNIDPTLTNTGGASGFIFGYTESIKWDPVTRQLFYVGMDHNQANPSQTQRFVSYSDSNNTWQILPSTSWMHTGATPSHGYDHMALDPVNLHR
ncbi:MAG: hypothetical protein DMG06_04500 [Acidobacteria bacterium]|nr:MAG: hypothetical protein DMG06_04500 [Acidobacteriota bacterium]